MDCNLSMVRGDTCSFGMELADSEGAAFDQDLDTAFFTVKTSYDATTSVFQKSLDNGITKAEGGYIVRIAPEDTRDVQAGKYYYDLELGVNDDIFTVLKGVLTIEHDVTI